MELIPMEAKISALARLLQVRWANSAQTRNCGKAASTSVTGWCASSVPDFSVDGGGDSI